MRDKLTTMLHFPPHSVLKPAQYAMLKEWWVLMRLIGPYTRN